MTYQPAVRTTLRAGDLGRIIELHGKVYDLLDGYGLRFEAYVGRTIAEFVLDNNAHGQIWLVERGDQLIGCAAIALREGNRGQLRNYGRYAPDYRSLCRCQSSSTGSSVSM